MGHSTRRRGRWATARSWSTPGRVPSSRPVVPPSGGDGYAGGGFRCCLSTVQASLEGMEKTVAGFDRADELVLAEALGRPERRFDLHLAEQGRLVHVGSPGPAHGR